jgi:CubicO group peptidase (beta-lactamase class C family)
MSLPWVIDKWDPKILQENGGYSSTNFMILGLILAANSGVSSWEEFNQASFMPESLRSKFEFGVTGAPSKYTAVHGYDRTSYNMPVNQTNDQDVWNVEGVFGGWTAADLVAPPSAVAELYYAIYGPKPSIAPNSNVLMPSPCESGGESFYAVATFCLGDYTGHHSPKYGQAWGHLGATYGFDSIVAFFPAFNFTFAMSSNIENDDQTHPAETICYSYTAVANLMLGQNASCKYSDGGYWGPSCKCDNFTAVETPAAVIV